LTPIIHGDEGEQELSQMEMTPEGPFSGSRFLLRPQARRLTESPASPESLGSPMLRFSPLGRSTSPQDGRISGESDLLQPAPARSSRAFGEHKFFRFHFEVTFFVLRFDHWSFKIKPWSFNQARTCWFASKPRVPGIAM
jgi:hypothetical protein